MNIYRDYSYNHGIIWKTLALILVIPKLMKEGHFTGVRSTCSLGFPFIIGIGSTMSLAIG